MSESDPKRPDSNGPFATPIFDELYDCACRLGSCEVVLEHIPYKRRRPGLALVVRRTEDGSVLHRAVARSGVEAAAARIRESLQHEASQRQGRE